MGAWLAATRQRAAEPAGGRAARHQGEIRAGLGIGAPRAPKGPGLDTRPGAPRRSGAPRAYAETLAMRWWGPDGAAHRGQMGMTHGSVRVNPTGMAMLRGLR
jgi:hypothetical protein